MKEHNCRFPHDPPEKATYMLETPNGCVCYPEDRIQYICEQHFIKGGMIGDWKIIGWMAESGLWQHS